MVQLELIGFGYRAGGGGGIGDGYRCEEADSRRLSGGRSPKKRARAMAEGADATRWSLEPHVCRHCFGRLVSQVRPDGDVRYHCTNCGAEAVGLEPSVLCACGLALRNHGPAGGVIDANLRCQPNPSPSPEFPSLFVAAEPRV